MIPHPFGLRTRDEVRKIAEQCVEDIVRRVREGAGSDAGNVAKAAEPADGRPMRVEAPADLEEFNRFCRACGWSDGLPLVPPTVERVETMLRHARRARD